LHRIEIPERVGVLPGGTRTVRRAPEHGGENPAVKTGPKPGPNPREHPPARIIEKSHHQEKEGHQHK
jgi:hypothetical protein